MERLLQGKIEYTSYTKALIVFNLYYLGLLRTYFEMKLVYRTRICASGVLTLVWLLILNQLARKLQKGLGPSLVKRVPL